MSKMADLSGEFALEIVRLTDCYSTDEVKVMATPDDISAICERYNVPLWLYDMVIAWSGHAFGRDGCLDGMRRRRDDEQQPMAERIVAQCAVIIAENWLRACDYAREHPDEDPARPV